MMGNVLNILTGMITQKCEASKLTKQHQHHVAAGCARGRDTIELKAKKTALHCNDYVPILGA